MTGIGFKNSYEGYFGGNWGNQKMDFMLDNIVSAFNFLCVIMVCVT